MAVNALEAQALSDTVTGRQNHSYTTALHSFLPMPTPFRPEKLPPKESEISSGDSTESQSAPSKSHTQTRDLSLAGQPPYDRRQFTVFQVDDFTFQPTTPRTTHWSVPWSDLMMTMFILFLIMFIYQTTHQQLLVNDKQEVVGGETTQALEIAPQDKGALPFAPIKPSLPLITGGTIKKIVPIHTYDLDSKTVFFSGNNQETRESIERRVQRPSASSTSANRQQNKYIPNDNASQQEPEFPAAQEALKGPISGPASDKLPESDKIDKLFNIIRYSISYNNLYKYASVTLITPSAVRIALNSDLFFVNGKAELTQNSLVSLQKIGSAIKETHFPVNVVGHTDSQPITSERFPSNWELSAARAAAIARFLIEGTDMNPRQFTVSGFASYRPLYPDTNMQNKAANRRIEIIIGNTSPETIVDKKL